MNNKTKQNNNKKSDNDASLSCPVLSQSVTPVPANNFATPPQKMHRKRQTKFLLSLVQQRGKEKKGEEEVFEPPGDDRQARKAERRKMRKQQ